MSLFLLILTLDAVTSGKKRALKEAEHYYEELDMLFPEVSE